jgi:hypothetical protein
VLDRPTPANQGIAVTASSHQHGGPFRNGEVPGSGRGICRQGGRKTWIILYNGDGRWEAGVCVASLGRIIGGEVSGGGEWRDYSSRERLAPVA